MSGLVTEPGFLRLTMDAYHADPAEQPSLDSKAASAIIDQSPMHAHWLSPRLNPDRAPRHERKFDVGSAFHSIVLEQVDLSVRLPYANYQKKAAQEERAACRAAGNIPLVEPDDDKLRSMLRAFEAQDGFELLGEGEPELSAFWMEEGVWCRSRPDWVRRDGVVINLKTVGDSAHPEAVARRVFAAGHDMQPVMQSRCVEVLLQMQPRFYWLSIETDAPHGLSLVRLGAASLAMGQRRLTWACRRWGECLQVDDWPGYEADPAPANYPKWIEDRWIAREIADDSKPVPMAATGHPNLLRYEA